MAFTCLYDQPTENFDTGSFIWRATNGGTVFNAIAYDATVFDYFDDDSVVDDALYFSGGTGSYIIAGLRFNVGTAISASSYTLVWEYYRRYEGWVEIEDLADDTNSFSITGQNDVKFPQQWQPHEISIEGSDRSLWVRCRLSAVNNITEGGANQTDRIKYGRGVLHISGTSDESPASFNNIYDWLITNQPHISVNKRNGNSFDFTMVGLDINSRVETTNEIIELGPDCVSNIGAGYNNLDYVTSGIKKSATKGYGGSTFIVYGVANSAVIECGRNSKFYGTTFKTGKNSSDNNAYAGYCTIEGEWIDCNVELSTKLPGAGDSANNCRIVGGLFIAFTLEGEFTNISYLCTDYRLFYVYYRGWTLKGFGYEFSGTSGIVIYLYQGSGNSDPFSWKLVNPSTPLNILSDDLLPIQIGNTKSRIGWDKIYTYDASTDTYSADLSGSTVPLYGDVGDMIYFSPSSNIHRGDGCNPRFSIATGANDYEYKWEFYENGAWVEPKKEWDQTLNLSQDGTWYLSTSMYADNATINGHTGDWIRATIITKGTGSPEGTNPQRDRCSGVNQWNLEEAYSLDLKVIDSKGTGIEGATVTATDKNGVEMFSVDTGADGAIAQQETLAKHWYFDPVNNPETLISENIYSGFDLKVSKSGYKEYALKGLALGSKIDWTIKLKPYRFREIKSR